MTEFIIKYWLQVLFAAALGLLTKAVRKEMKDQKAIKLGVQAILRDRLIQSYNHHTEKGCCAIHDRENVLNMYNQYHNLGANGVIDGLVEEVMGLPVRKC